LKNLKLYNMNFQEIYNEAMKQGREYAIKTEGENLMIYPCGFAWVVFDTRSSFGKWLKENNIGSKGYPSGWHIWIGGYNQSMSHKEAHAIAMTIYLQQQGIKCSAHSRLD